MLVNIDPERFYHTSYGDKELIDFGAMSSLKSRFS